MKTPPRNSHACGFTLLEMLIAINVVFIAGALVFLALNTGMTLYTKNTAVNTAHQQARSGVDEMLANIHASVSIPQLIDINGTPLPQPGTGPAEGLNYQRFLNGPFAITQNALANATALTIFCPAFTPPASLIGLRFNIPSHKVEQDVLGVSASFSGGFRTITFGNPIGSDVIVTADGTGRGDGNGNNTSFITGFFTCRASYVVMGQDLRYFPNNDFNTSKVIARNITSAKPFSILFNPKGGIDVRSVAAVQLSTAEPQFSNRGYAAVNMFINSYIPFRTQLTVFQ
jgi:type II secretory pathway pseudopilin PulG